MSCMASPTAALEARPMEGVSVTTAWLGHVPSCRQGGLHVLEEDGGDDGGGDDM